MSGDQPRWIDPATGTVVTDTDSTVGSYLSSRLHQIGVRHVFAIPGDYIASWVESLDDGRSPVDLERVHPNNEMCATYAADGYGRATKDSVGCVAFTYGVGAMNALQPVAGALVENVPLVIIDGCPSKAQFNSQRDQGILWHHMTDGTGVDLRVFRNVTAYAVRIDNPHTAPDQIDTALTVCITESKPVFIELSMGIDQHPCKPVPKTPLKPVPSLQSETLLDEAVKAAYQRIIEADNVVVVGGSEIARHRAQDDFAKLLRELDAPYLSSMLGKGVLSEYREDVAFSGVYNGRNSQKNVRQLVHDADCILSIGVLDTDFNFAGMYNAGDPAAVCETMQKEEVIDAKRGAVQIGLSPNQYWGDVNLTLFIQKLTNRLSTERTTRKAYRRLEGTPWDIPVISDFPSRNQVTWESFKAIIHHGYLESFDEEEAPVILADTGLSFYAFNNIKVPQNGYIAQLSWGAIGYTPAANYGVKLAQQTFESSSRRVISICGDAAFAESINAIGTIAELGLDSIIFVVDNKVYAVEQWLVNAAIFNPNQKERAVRDKFLPMCQVPQGHVWDYAKLAAGFGGVGYSAYSNADLQEIVGRLMGKVSGPLSLSDKGAAEESNVLRWENGVPITNRNEMKAEQPTFTLVAVQLVPDELPRNVAWKAE